jgi:hypothetical protein
LRLAFPLSLLGLHLTELLLPQQFLLTTVFFFFVVGLSKHAAERAGRELRPASLLLTSAAIGCLFVVLVVLIVNTLRRITVERSKW